MSWGFEKEGEEEEEEEEEEGEEEEEEVGGLEEAERRRGRKVRELERWRGGGQDGGIPKTKYRVRFCLFRSVLSLKFGAPPD